MERETNVFCEEENKRKNVQTRKGYSSVSLKKDLCDRAPSIGGNFRFRRESLTTTFIDNYSTTEDEE